MTLPTLTKSALERIAEVTAKQENEKKFLRVAILGGGCSGFQYDLKLDDKLADEDVKILEDGKKIVAVTDETSLPFLENAQIDFVRELGASYFKVINPNAKASCGCGSSFSV